MSRPGGGSGRGFWRAAWVVQPFWYSASRRSTVASSGSVGFLLAMTGHQRDALFVVGATAGLTTVLNLS